MTRMARDRSGPGRDDLAPREPPPVDPRDDQPRDPVDEAAEETFPASDPPAWQPLHTGAPGEHGPPKRSPG